MTPPSLAEIEAKLTGPGAPFEMESASVYGRPATVFKNRARNLRELLERSEKYGDRELFVFEDGLRLSFVEHLRRVASTAASLRDVHGIGKGDRVALLGANSVEWIIGLWGTLSLGGIAVAMNGWWTEDEIRYGLELTEPKLLIADRRRLGRLSDGDPRVPCVEMESGFDALWSHDRDAALPDVAIDEDDPATILFTSGTTGRPKGAISTHRNLIAFLDISGFSQARTAALHGIELDADARPQQVGIASSPLFHVSGLQSQALANVAYGNKSVWTLGRFDETKIYELTLEHGITRWGGVTTQVMRLLEHPDFDKYDFSQIQSVGGGGSTWGPEVQRLCREKLPRAAAAMSVGYGLTECGGLCSIATNDILLEHPDSVGGALPTAEITIRDDDWKELPDGTDGNICIRGAMVMPGYWNNPEATADAISPDGWLKSGDIGHLRDGLLFLASRKRDMIIRGGENIYPVEIENRLELHPDIAEAAVVGVDHRVLGQEVKAVVVPRRDATLEEQAVKDFVAETLAYYKVPTYVEVRSEPLPRNASGKVLKAVLTGEAKNIFIEE